MQLSEMLCQKQQDTKHIQYNSFFSQVNIHLEKKD